MKKSYSLWKIFTMVWTTMVWKCISVVWKNHTGLKTYPWYENVSQQYENVSQWYEKLILIWKNKHGMKMTSMNEVKKYENRSFGYEMRFLGMKWVSSYQIVDFHTFRGRFHTEWVWKSRLFFFPDENLNPKKSLVSQILIPGNSGNAGKYYYLPSHRTFIF